MMAADRISTSHTPVSKVLFLDDGADDAGRIKRFCDDNGLVPLKVRKESVMQVLRSNVDLGGVLYSETYGDSLEETTRIAVAIHQARPELPIIMRREREATLEGLPADLRGALCAAYVAHDMPALRAVLDHYIFCLIYPNALLRGISEITVAVLKSQCPRVTVHMDTPYIVHDRAIFGELFSLIQLESPWCRGYMMLQIEENDFLALMHPTEEWEGLDAAALFRRVNDILSEITNLIWGGFKNRYIGDSAVAGNQVQIPIIINHRRKYLSFGTENPQLCFRFTLTDADTGYATMLFARFAFNLSWSPQDFREIVPDIAGLVGAGEIEFF